MRVDGSGSEEITIKVNELGSVNMSFKMIP